MSYDNNNNFGGGNKPDPTAEKSLKYISQHLSFKLKDELKEVISPLIEGLTRVAAAIEAASKQFNAAKDAE